MSRAAYRRDQKAENKKNTAIYTYTEAQLEAVIQARIGKKLEEVKRKATDDAINTAMTLLLTLPMEVLMDFYWQKTYPKKIPEFAQHVLDYYEMWQDGKLSMDEMIEDLWKYGGIKIEEGE